MVEVFGKEREMVRFIENVRGLAADPKNSLLGLRLGLRTALTNRFDTASPISQFEEAQLSTLYSQSVVLPPKSLRQEEGNQSFEGLIALVGLGNLIQARSFFEIGTYNGFTALTLALNFPEAAVFTLDLPPETPPALQLDDGDKVHIAQRSVRSYEGHESAQRITQFLGDSATFDFSPFFGTIDLVYVDGSHSYEYVTKDTDTAHKLVSPGGAIVWDDYWRSVPDVPQYLDAYSAGQIYRIPDTRLVVRLMSGGNTSFARTRSSRNRY